MNEYRVLDISYGNLRLVDKKSNIVVMELDTLEKLINTKSLKIVKEKNQKYPHLTLDIN